jgi:hypothetical protein
VLASSRLMVDVRPAMLVKADSPGSPCGRFGQTGRVPGPELAWDDREVDRQTTVGEQIEQGPQALVVPADVVVAKEELDRMACAVQRRSQRVEPVSDRLTSSWPALSLSLP